MTINWSDEEQESAPRSPVVESTPSGQPADEVEVTTAPVKVVPVPVPVKLLPPSFKPARLPVKRTGPFRIYSHDDPDLTDEMRLEIELRMTAGWWLEKALQQEKHAEMPEEFRERKTVWKIILQEAAVGLFILLTGWLLVSGIPNGWINLVVVGVLLFELIVAFYAYKLWSVTFIVATATKTGIAREGVRWMFISVLEPELMTSSVDICVPYRNSIFAFFGVNWWRIRLDTAAQNESATHLKMRFARDGARLSRTVEQYKQALR